MKLSDYQCRKCGTPLIVLNNNTEKPICTDCYYYPIKSNIETVNE